MAGRLPVPGQDNGVWGDILNDYLSVEHNTDGTLKRGVDIDQAQADAAQALVTAQQAASATIADNSVTKTKLATAVQTSLDKADTALQTAPVTSVAGKTGAVTIAKTDIGLDNVDNTSDADKDSATATLTNKTIDGTQNTLTNIPQTAIDNLSGTYASTTYVDNQVTDTASTLIPATQKAVPNGVATLDGTGKIPTAQIPSVPVNETFVVGSEAAMLALSAAKGDRAIRTDVGSAYAEYVLQATPASTLGNWIGVPNTVASVDGRIGPVSLSDRYPLADTTGAVNGQVLTYDAPNSIWKPTDQALGSAALATFTIATTPLTLGYVAAPGFVAVDNTTLNTVEVRAYYPPLGSPLQVRLWKITSSAMTQIGGLLSIAAGGRRAVATGLATTLAPGDEIRAEIVAVGGSYGGGGSLQVTLAGSGVSFPAVAAAPNAATNFSASGAGGGVSLSWTASSNATEYILFRNSVPIATLPAATVSHVDTTAVEGNNYTYALYAANSSASIASGTGSASPLAGAYYTGAELVSDSAHWTLTQGVGGSVTVSASDSVWATATNGTGTSKSGRVFTGSHMSIPAVTGATKITARVHWEQEGIGFEFKLRRDSADVYGVIYQVNYFGTNNMQIRARRAADGAHTIIKQGSVGGSGVNQDYWIEIYDDPTNGIYEIRQWPSNGSRPATATFAATNADPNYAYLADSSIATGYAYIANTPYGGATTAKLITLRSLQIEALQ